MSTLVASLQRALERRVALIDRLHGEGTDCYRLLHGVAEGEPGITVDRYGSLLLVQTFRDPLDRDTVEAVRTAGCAALGVDLPIVANHRGAPPTAPCVPYEPTPAALAEHECREAGARFVIRARHRGQDPWLFLDLRAGRAAVRSLAAGRTVLNLFAYTCGVGVAAALGGATAVCNVDFARSALDVGAENAARNGIGADRFTVLHADCLPVLRQLAGTPVQRRGRHLPYPRIERRRFDVVMLDPPRFAKTPFGTIDVVRDYQSLWKPCLLALNDGGAIVATNHVPGVTVGEWHDLLLGCAAKAGRPLRSLEPVPVDGDFPSFDGNPPLKVVLARI